jgi:glycosyltransferase involved in cell wall biosynthesis
VIGKAQAMKVLYCILDDRCGGPHRLAHDVALRLREHDIETLFLLGCKTGEAWQPEGFRSFSCKHIQLLRRRRPLWSLVQFFGALPFNLATMSRIIRTNGIDLVHVDSLHNFVPALAARLAGKPLVWLYNDYLPVPVRRLLLSLAGALASTFLVQGENLKQLHTGDRPKLRGKTAVLYSGVDTRRFAPDEYGPEQRRRIREELGLPAECTLVGAIRNMHRLKGYTYFLEAAARIKSRVPSAKFLIVGRKLDTDPGYWEHLQQLTGQLGLGQDVIFAGFREDIPAILSALDVFVLASIEESCPVALLEAMAMRVPVVATEVGAVPELVIDGRTGFVVPPRDSEAIAGVTLRLLAMPRERLDAMVEAAQERVKATFDVDAIALQQKRIYESLTECNHRQGLRP